MSQILTAAALRQAVGRWIGEGRRVAGPVRSGGAVHYAWLEGGESLETRGFIRPVNSIKGFLLPRHEKLFAFRTEGRRVQLTPVAEPDAEQVIVAARPCDAAALPILDHVFQWGRVDESFRRRRERTTVVTLACREHDEHCFCTSVGLGPDSERGADAMLLPVDEEHFEVRGLTDQGRSLLGPWTIASQRTGAAGPGPAREFSLDGVQQFLADGFDDEVWQTFSLRCLGCSACAHNCPTCHCFDMVDESVRGNGHRVRNWDSCQTSLYSLHASGHNPRAGQAARQRNRILHKYLTYPQKFGDLLCTGCGACSRNCPVALGVRNVLTAVQDLPARGDSR